MGILDRFLRKYEDADLVIKMKARFFLVLFIVILILLPAAILNTVRIQLGNPALGNRVHFSVVLPEIVAFALVLGLAFLFLRGRFELSANLLLVLVSMTVWLVMFSDTASVVSRLDTIAFVYAVLVMSSVATAKRGYVIFAIGGANIAALFVFILVKRDQLAIPPSAVEDFLSDNFLAMCFVIVAAFSIFVIGRKALLRASMELEEHRKAEERTRESLKEKEVLLRELYHRTKNNMQMVTSMLSLQADSLEDSRDVRRLEEVKNRIYAMSLVHEKLYESRDLSHVGLRGYVSDLVGFLAQSYEDPSRRAAIRSEIAEIVLPIDIAIPFGLILNELVSNAFKYAFPGAARGEILVRVDRGSDGFVELLVRDDGAGVPEGFDFRRDKGMGIETVLILAEDQLRGEVAFDTRAGVECRVRFRADREAGRNP